MYAILCLKDGDSNTTMPIVKDDGDTLATWETLAEAREFSDGHILCQISEVLFIDLDNGLIEG